MTTLKDYSRVEIIIGCMFSGKSTELLRRCRRYKSIGKNVVLINHTEDTRSKKTIKTHTNDTSLAIKLNDLGDLHLHHRDIFMSADIIGIDEAQFFYNLRSFILFAEHYNKTIIIAGLDGDFNRNPFGQILECIPLCDEVIKLTALDMIDQDGSPAIFTRRIMDSKEQVVIGTTGSYRAVSRKTYHLTNEELGKRQNLDEDITEKHTKQMTDYDNKIVCSIFHDAVKKKRSYLHIVTEITNDTPTEDAKAIIIPLITKFCIPLKYIDIILDYIRKNSGDEQSDGYNSPRERDEEENMVYNSDNSGSNSSLPDLVQSNE